MSSVRVPRSASSSRRGRWSSAAFAICSLPEFAGEFVEQLGEAADEEAAQVAHAVVVELAGLEGDEDDLLEGLGRRIVGRADGERGLAHAAGTVDERAPGADLRVERVGDLPQLLLAPEEGLERRKIVRDGSTRGVAVAMTDLV